MRSVPFCLALLGTVSLGVACRPAHRKMSTVTEERDAPLPADPPGLSAPIEVQAGAPRPASAAEAGPDLGPGGAVASAVPSAAGPAPVPAQAVQVPVGTGAASRPAAGQAAAAPSAALLADARHFYAQRCALCHGATGRGDGVAAVNLRPRPRSFAEPGWQTSVRDEDVGMVIVRGGTAIGRSMMMPASTDLVGRPELVRALVAVVRGFGVPAPGAQAP